MTKEQLFEVIEDNTEFKHNEDAIKDAFDLYISSSKPVVKKYVTIATHIESMNKHMAEMFMRHDYRSMYEIWQSTSQLLNQATNDK